MKKKEEIPPVNTIAAIAWAADKQGLSYGRFAPTLDKKAKLCIYTEYAEFLAAREKEEANQPVAIVKPMPDYGSRFNPALINSKVDTGMAMLPH